MTPVVTGVHRGQRFEELLESLVSVRFASRLFAQDSTLWGDDAQAEAAVRLGWTDFAGAAHAVSGEASVLRSEFAAQGVDRFVLCGMGGSSLAPMVIAPDLSVLDSTHPDTVRAAISGDLSRTAVVISSKSGTTIETLSHRAAFEAAFADAGIDPASRIVIVTDPGSELETYARNTGMRVFNADPNTGGRFSALTAFGLVPSVLAGAQVAEMVNVADASREALRQDSPDNPALVLAAAVAAGLPERFVLDVRCGSGVPMEFGWWIEQLVAESTGKSGKGVLPISAAHDAYRCDSRSVLGALVTAKGSPGAGFTGLQVQGSLGEQFLLWETATAALGHLLGVDPFNQPDVEAAKVAARAMLAEAEVLSDAPVSPESLIDAVRTSMESCEYLAIQAYANPHAPGLGRELETLREALSESLGKPVALGWGPRYLHSTGQLHKGGPAVGAYLQLVDSALVDLSIPGSDSTSFGELFTAQAHGDATVLRERGRTVTAVACDDIGSYVRAVIAAI